MLIVDYKADFLVQATMREGDTIEVAHREKHNDWLI